jgi:inorganic pyrophosphatase
VEDAMTQPITMVVEIPRGSRNKYETDHETGEIFLDRTLFTSTQYPADYGFLPDTLAEDGDPLDIMVLLAEPTFPGCRVRVRPIGVFLMEDQGHADHRVIAVPWGDPRWEATRDIDDLPEHLRLELEHFFAVYRQRGHTNGSAPGSGVGSGSSRPLTASRGPLLRPRLEQKKTAAIGWKPAAEATTVIAAALARYSPR